MHEIQYRAAQTKREQPGYRGERALWAAVIKTALEDLGGGWGGTLNHGSSEVERGRNRAESLAYLRSEWFETHCEWLGLDPDAIREGIQRRRAA